MVELVDTLDSKSNDSNIVPVQVRPWAPKRINRTILVRFFIINYQNHDKISKENYSDDELASTLNLTIDEIKQKRNRDIIFIKKG